MAIALDLSVLYNISADGSQGERLTASASAKPQRIEAASPRSTAAASKAAPFTDTTGTRDYKRLYRAALDFHTSHYPPTVDTAYWGEHSPDATMPPIEEAYWKMVGGDMIEALREAGEGTDEFLIALLWAIADELTREYKRLIQEAASTHSVNIDMSTDTEELTQEPQSLGIAG